MKPTVATALSVAGVLAAGALAIAANTAVFAEPDVAPVSGIAVDQPVTDTTVAPDAPADGIGPAADLRPGGYSPDEDDDDEDEMSGREDGEYGEDGDGAGEPEEWDDDELDDD